MSQTGIISYVGDLETVRYNVAYRNREVCGICLPGDWTNRYPPSPQLKATKRLLQYLLEILPGRQIVGHGQIADPRSPTACPGATFAQWRASILP